MDIVMRGLEELREWVRLSERDTGRDRPWRWDLHFVVDGGFLAFYAGVSGLV